jgi:prepilin-type N-terminal cleavage/methylation domain-containing protein
MNTLSIKKGFTALELLIVVGILGLVALITLASFYAYQKNNALEYAATRVVGLLEEARNSTMSSKNDIRYGVHFETTEAVLFEGNSYTAGATGNKSVTLGQGVTFSVINIAGGGSNIVFDRLTGQTSMFGTTTLSITTDVVKTIDIVVHKTGLIEQL